ncbi:MAG: hypothetical protein ACHP83_18100 [Burkholderiales bacterium]
MLLAMSSSAQQAQARDEALELKFADFFVQPVGPRGLTIADALRAADGRRVRLVGYMVSQEQPMPGQFMLTPRPVRISEHADGEASDLPPATVLVMLDERQRDRVIAHQPGLIALAGRLEVGRAEDPCGRVSWVRLRLDPKSIADDGLDGPPDKQASAMDPRPATPQQ